MSHRRERTTLGVICGLFGVAFLFAASLHGYGGVGSGTLAHEPRTLELAVAEFLSGVVLCVGAVGLLTRRNWGWRAALSGNVLGLGTSVLGLLAPQLGLAFRTDFDRGFFVMMLVLTGFALIALFRERPRNFVKRTQNRVAARLY
jgi:hypothetical protein